MNERTLELLDRDLLAVAAAHRREHGTLMAPERVAEIIHARYGETHVIVQSAARDAIVARASQILKG